MIKGVQRYALLKGVSQGSRLWLGLGIASTLIKAMSQTKRDEEVVLRRELKSGETLLVTRYPDSPGE